MAHPKKRPQLQPDQPLYAYTSYQTKAEIQQKMRDLLQEARQTLDERLQDHPGQRSEALDRLGDLKKETRSSLRDLRASVEDDQVQAEVELAALQMELLQMDLRYRVEPLTKEEVPALVKDILSAYFYKMRLADHRYRPEDYERPADALAKALYYSSLSGQDRVEDIFSAFDQHLENLKKKAVRWPIGELEDYYRDLAHETAIAMASNRIADMKSLPPDEAISALLQLFDLENELLFDRSDSSFLDVDFDEMAPEDLDWMRSLPRPQDIEARGEWVRLLYKLGDRDIILREELDLVVEDGLAPIQRINFYDEVSEEKTQRFNSVIFVTNELELREDYPSPIFQTAANASGLELKMKDSYGSGELVDVPFWYVGLDELEAKVNDEVFSEWFRDRAEEARVYLEAARDNDEVRAAVEGLMDLDYLAEHPEAVVAECFFSEFRPIGRSVSYRESALYVARHHPTFHELLVSQEASNLELFHRTVVSREREHRLGEVPSYREYQDSFKADLLDSADAQLRRTWELLDAETPGFNKEEEKYARYTWTFMKEDFPLISEELPLLFGDDEEVVDLMCRRLIQNGGFPRVRVLDQGELAGSAYESYFELDDNFNSYRNFQHTAVHEFFHVAVQKVRSDTTFEDNLSEGITEMLTHKAAREAGVARFYDTSYPGVTKFAERLYNGVGPKAVLIFYSGMEVPRVSFDDLPTFSVDGNRLNYLSGVRRLSSGEKYLARALLDQMDSFYLGDEGILDTDFRNQRQVFEDVNAFFKDFFNTQFGNEDYGYPMSGHYENMTRRLDQFLVLYGEKK